MFTEVDHSCGQPSTMGWVLERGFDCDRLHDTSL